MYTGLNALINPSREEKDNMRMYAKSFFAPWYSGDQEWAPAYIVMPSNEAETFIEHQFNDTACEHAYFLGIAVPITGVLGEALDREMRSSDPSSFELDFILNVYGMGLGKVIGQGLIELNNGWFILTEGND